MKLFLPLLYLLLFLSCRPESSFQKAVSDSAGASVIVSKNTKNPIPILESATVVDYYRMLVQGGHIDREYNFKETKNGWICYYEEDEERNYPCVVDIKNGYLSVEDEGTGGGDGITEFVSYKTNDGRLIFAYNTYSRGPAMYYIVVEDVQLHFFEYTKNTFFDITEKVLQEKITPELFLDGSYKNDAALSLYYQLTGAEGSIDILYNENFCDFCKNLDENRERMQMEDEYYEEQLEHCAVCEHIVRKEVSLVFDKQRGVFTIEKQ